MKFEKKAFGDVVNILACDHYAAMQSKIDFTDFPDGVAKAGTPIAKDGKKATTSGEPAESNAIGILLHDVYKDSPNGAVILHGFIQEQKAQIHSGVTVDDATKAALTMINFV